MSDKWEEVTRDELAPGDHVRITYEGSVVDPRKWGQALGVPLVTRHGPGAGAGSLDTPLLSDVIERKVKPSPEALRAAKAVLLGRYGLGIAEAQPLEAEVERFARIIDEAMRGES